MFTAIPAVLLALAISVAADSTCYLRQNDQIRVKPGWFACKNTAETTNGPNLCCQDGDLCGEHSICKASNPQEGNDWYVGGCTDKTYKDPICAKQCSSYKQTYITFNTSKADADLWACCGDYDCADGPPTTKLFKAPAPADWTEISQPSPGLDLPTKIGIGIGAAAGAVIIFGAVSVAIGFYLRRRRRAASTAGFGLGGKKKVYEQVNDGGDVQMQVPFVRSENQPYSRPHSPMPGQAEYHDQPTSEGVTPHQPPED